MTLDAPKIGIHTECWITTPPFLGRACVAKICGRERMPEGTKIKWGWDYPNRSCLANFTYVKFCACNFIIRKQWNKTILWGFLKSRNIFEADSIFDELWSHSREVLPCSLPSFLPCRPSFLLQIWLCVLSVVSDCGSWLIIAIWRWRTILRAIFIAHCCSDTSLPRRNEHLDKKRRRFW